MADVLPLLPRQSPEDEAAAWIARIDAGALSATDRMALGAWIAADAAHAELLDDHARAWALATVAGKAAEPRPQVIRSRRNLWGGGIAASIALAAAALAIAISSPAGPDTAPSLRNRYVTAVGDRQSIRLPDGSRAVLNTATELEVDYGDALRSLTLVRGEVAFDVMTDAARPFVVRAGDTVARAVGTEFIVRRLSPQRVSVVVTEGRVEVSETPAATDQAAPSARANHPTALVAAGQRAAAADASVVIATLDRRQLERATGWAGGGITFRDERLRDVLDEVNRYADRPVILADPALGEIRVSGYFAIPNVARFVEGLSAGVGLDARADREGVIVLERQG